MGGQQLCLGGLAGAVQPFDDKKPALAHFCLLPFQRGVLGAHLGGAAAAHPALRAGAGHAGRAGGAEDMGCHRVDQPQHLFGQLPYLPLGAIAAAQVEEVLQAAGVHGHHHLGLAGVGQHEAGVLVGLLGSLGPGLLFGQTFGHQAGGVAVFQLLHEVEVAPGVLVHALDERRLCLGDGLDLGRDDVAEIIQTDVPLTLDAEGRDAVAGDLGQQGTADTPRCRR